MVMDSTGMKLRKWASNDADLITSRLPSEDIELTNVYEIDSSVKKK